MPLPLAQLIAHPERLNSDTLPELRQIVAAYPHFHAARLLLLRNLFLCQDPDFSAELRRAALLLPNREVIFQMIHGQSYIIDTTIQPSAQPKASAPSPKPESAPAADRTEALLNAFLHPNGTGGKATAVDPRQDYMSYLAQQAAPETQDPPTPSPGPAQADRTDTLINNFIDRAGERLITPALQAAAQADSPSPASAPAAPEETTHPSYFTETLAQIYLKQGKYERALEIIQQLHLHNPKKSAYFADQIRFLRKVISIQAQTQNAPKAP